MLRHCRHNLITTGNDKALPSLLSRTFALLLLTFILPNANASLSYWQTNYNAALAKARSEEKPLLIYFTGSDWCLWCQKLDRELLNQEAFAGEIEELAVPILLDFPQRRKLPPREARHNREFKSRFKVEAFPTIILYDPSMNKEIWRHSYFDTAPRPYLDTLKSLLNERNDEVSTKQE